MFRPCTGGEQCVREGSENGGGGLDTGPPRKILRVVYRLYVKYRLRSQKKSHLLDIVVCCCRYVPHLNGMHPSRNPDQRCAIKEPAGNRNRGRNINISYQRKTDASRQHIVNRTTSFEQAWKTDIVPSSRCTRRVHAKVWPPAVHVKT